MPETLAPALPDDLDAKVEKVLAAACDQGLRLVTAESCTGGLMASLLTDVTGCSHAFERGFVTYTDEAKTELLGVSPELLRDYGAVSQPVAIAMAEGALTRSHGDIALAITGFAGPGENAEPGLVHFAFARRGGETKHERHHFQETDRAGVRLRCIETGLRLLSEHHFQHVAGLPPGSPASKRSA